MAAFDAVKLLAWRFAFAAYARDRQVSFVVLQLHVILAEPRQFHHHHVAIRRFEHVNGRSPAGRTGDKAVQPLLGSQQILEWVPANESHGGIVPCQLPTPKTPTPRHPEPVARSPKPAKRLCYDRKVLQTVFMASIQATRLKKGNLVKMDQDLYRVLELQHVTPGNLRGFVRIKLRNIRNGTLSDQKLRSEDTVERAVLDERQMQYLYQDADDYYFMDTVTFDQIHITSEALGESVNYLKPEMTISVEFYGTEPVGIELPQTVDLKVTDTAPGIKGATASAQVKPATLETGLVVQVPPFVNPGDSIRVSTDTGEYLSRA